MSAAVPLRSYSFSGGEFDNFINATGIDTAGANYVKLSLSSPYNSDAIGTPTFSFETVGAHDLGTNVTSNRAQDWVARYLAPAVGTGKAAKVQWTGDQAANRCVLGVEIFGNVDQTTPEGPIAGASGEGGTPTVDATTVIGDLVVSSVATGTPTAVTPTSPQVSTFAQAGADVANGGYGEGSYKTATGTTETMSHTNPSNDAWSILAFALKGISGDITITPAGMTGAAAVGTPTVQKSNNITITPGGMIGAAAIGSFTIQTDITLINIPSMTGVAAVGVPTIVIVNNTGKLIQPVGMTGAAAIGTPTIVKSGGSVTITPGGMIGSPAVGVPNVQKFQPGAGGGRRLKQTSIAIGIGI